MKKEMKLWEKLFVIFNIVFILFCIVFYLCRGIHYYKKTNGVSTDSRLVSKITNSNNITYQGDGLYKLDGGYYYRGKDVNNYVYYSGRLWRIVKINDIGIELITDDNQSSLVWGIDSNYQDSYIYSWLNNDIFLNSLFNKDYIVAGKWCNSAITIDNYQCDESLDALVGLLSTQDYILANGKDSYLNDGSYWWTINNSSDDKMPYYIYKDGGINNQAKYDDTYYSYGVRPVIYLDININYDGGDGTIDNPFMIDKYEGSEISNFAVGNYVKYNDYLFRIMEINNDYTKIILAGNLLVDNQEIKLKYNELNKYLNNEFLNKFNKDDLVKIDYTINNYNSVNKYSYNDYTNEKYNGYVGISNVGSLFSIFDNSWMNSYLDKSSKLVYTSLIDGELYGDLLDNTNGFRPVMAIKNDLLIVTGNGTKNNPLIVGDGE